MGKVFSSLVKRPAKNWNIESRVNKVLDQSVAEKPKVAPKHQTTQAKLEKFRQENPELLEAQKIKHEDLHARLAGMVVNPDKVEEVKSSSRPLPEDRINPPEYAYGYKEPSIIPEGRISIKQTLELLSKHSASPQEFTSEILAKEYKLSHVTVQSILKHFNMLMLQMPTVNSGEDATSKVISPGSLRNLLGKGVTKSLPESVKEKS